MESGPEVQPHEIFHRFQHDEADCSGESHAEKRSRRTVFSPSLRCHRIRRMVNGHLPHPGPERAYALCPSGRGLFRLLKKRLGSRVSGDTEQIDLRERGVAVFSSSADGFLPLLFLNRRRNSGGWAHLSFAGGRMLDVVLPQEKRCGYAGHARLSRRQPAGAEFLPRDGGKASSRTRAGLFGRSRESRLLFLARIADRKGERDRKNGLVRLVLSSPELAVRLQMLCLSLGLNTRLSMAAPHTVLEIPPSPAFLHLCESAEMAVVDGTGQDEVRTARFSASAALPLTGKNDSYEFLVDGEGYDINGVEVQE